MLAPGVVLPHHDAAGNFAFSQWHFNDMPFNPDNLTLPVLVEQMWSRNPSASWLLGQAVLTLRTTKCRYALNFMIRFALHVLGDMHQPLHATEGFFNNTRFGDLSDGDWGGNKIHKQAHRATFPICTPCGTRAARCISTTGLSTLRKRSGCS